MQIERRAPSAEHPALEIHRSPRRRRSADAALRDGRVVLRLPAGLDAAEEQALIDRLLARVVGRARAKDLGGDDALRDRAHRLADRYLDGVRATSVTWSTRMARRHGSCTPATGQVRISVQLTRVPDYVLDYVLVHELAHLQVADHSPAFWSLVARYPQAERARGFLEGFEAGQLRLIDDEQD